MTRYKLSTTQFDPALLLPPFRVQTNWVVLTGAACTGKTTLIEVLAENGYPVIKESAHQCFETELAKGRTLTAIRSDCAVLQHRITALQVGIEQGFPAAPITFLDGLPT